MSSTDQAVAALGTDARAGLSLEEARRRLARHGPNALPQPHRASLVVLFLRQFKSPLIYLLLGAAVIAFALGHRSDAVVILVVVAINAIIGGIQEGRAERSLEGLRRLATHRARVVRGGEQHVVDAHELVPGDLVLLEAGDAITADGRVLEAAALQVIEAALTGESGAVGKSAAAVPEDTSLADRSDMVYAGTYATAGRGPGAGGGARLGPPIGDQPARGGAGRHPPPPPQPPG
ncbi:MAG: P-type ATPase, partial [Kofleriaceae bacterium]